MTGKGLDAIIERYHKFGKPVFDEFIYATGKYVDLFVQEELKIRLQLI